VKSIITIIIHLTTTVLFLGTSLRLAVPNRVFLPLVSIEFPLFLLFIAFFSLTSTAFLYQNHAKLVNGEVLLCSAARLLNPARRQ